MEQLIRVHPDDLRLETLEAIRQDLANYAHLSAYRKTFRFLCDVIVARREHVKND